MVNTLFVLHRVTFALFLLDHTSLYGTTHIQHSSERYLMKHILHVFSQYAEVIQQLRDPGLRHAHFISVTLCL
jgi:hypothetical protein